MFQTRNITIRKWLRESELTFNTRLEQAFADEQCKYTIIVFCFNFQFQVL
jgi:hypothetical protein